MANFSQKINTVADIRQISQVKSLTTKTSNYANDAQNPLMNISKVTQDISGGLSKINNLLTDPTGFIKDGIDNLVDSFTDSLFSTNVSTGALTDLLHKVDEPLLKTHTICFFTTPAPEVTDFIQDNFSLDQITDIVSSARSMKNLGDVISLVDKVGYTARKLMKKDRISGNFFTNLNRQNRGTTSQKFAFNIESTIGNLQQERNMQPTIANGFSGGVFTSKFNELDDLSVTRTILLWFLYIKNVNEGTISPNIQNILNNIVDYKTSAYIFIVKPNLKEILYFGKYTGIFPTNVPMDIFESDKDNMTDVKLDVEFSFDLFEPLDPRIIDEFNNLARSGSDVITRSNTADNMFEFSKR